MNEVILSNVTSRKSHLKSHGLINFGAGERGGYRPAHAGQHRDIVKLAHRALDTNPLHDVAGAKIDDLQAAPAVGVTLLHLVVERKTRERTVARQRQAHDRVVVVEREPT